MFNRFWLKDKEVPKISFIPIIDKAIDIIKTNNKNVIELTGIYTLLFQNYEIYKDLSFNKISELLGINSRTFSKYMSILNNLSLINIMEGKNGAKKGFYFNQFGEETLVTDVKNTQVLPQLILRSSTDVKNTQGLCKKCSGGDVKNEMVLDIPQENLQRLGIVKTIQNKVDKSAKILKKEEKIYKNTVVTDSFNKEKKEEIKFIHYTKFKPSEETKKIVLEDNNKLFFAIYYRDDYKYNYKEKKAYKTYHIWIQVGAEIFNIDHFLDKTSQDIEHKYSFKTKLIEYAEKKDKKKLKGYIINFVDFHTEYYVRERERQFHNEKIQIQKDIQASFSKHNLPFSDNSSDIKLKLRLFGDNYSFVLSEIRWKVITETRGKGYSDYKLELIILEQVEQYMKEHNIEFKNLKTFERQNEESLMEEENNENISNT